MGLPTVHIIDSTLGRGTETTRTSKWIRQSDRRDVSRVDVLIIIVIIKCPAIAGHRNRYVRGVIGYTVVIQIRGYVTQ